jgi:hypothetical protein
MIANQQKIRPSALAESRQRWRGRFICEHCSAVFEFGRSARFTPLNQNPIVIRQGESR